MMNVLVAFLIAVFERASRKAAKFSAKAQRFLVPLRDASGYIRKC
jgi:hypothetical protein